MRKFSNLLAVVGVFFIGWMAHGAYTQWGSYAGVQTSFADYLERSAEIVADLPDLMSGMPDVPEVDPETGPTDLDELVMEQRILTKELMGDRQNEVFAQLEAMRLQAEAEAKMKHEIELKKLEAWTEIGKVGVPVLLTAFFGFIGLRRSKD